MFLIFLAILSSLFYIGEASNPPICDVYNLSLTLCNSEINCVKHMFLDENVNDNATFNFLVNRVISNYLVVGFIDDIICNSTEAQALWMVILKDFNFCEHVNEYYSAHLQRCVCRTDKICNHRDHRNNLFIFSETQIFIWALLIVIAAITIPVIQEITVLKKAIRDILMKMGITA